MGRHIKQIQKRAKILKSIEDLFDNSSTVLVIHYSCESFYNTDDGRTPRVTSIALRNLESGQTQSFSIHKIAEQNNIPANLVNQKYDNLERQMLDEYFEFIQQRIGYDFLHWNMRDINYGFPALEHRYKVLQGEPWIIDDHRKHNLARYLVELYGRDYIAHPRLESITDKNSITKIGFLKGKEEAEAFQEAEYVKLHQSTLRKVNIIADIVELVVEGRLKTDISWLQRQSIHPQVLAELVKEHWFFVLFAFILGIVGIALTIYNPFA